MEKSSPLSGNASLVLLVLVNLLPIAGVLFWGWDAFEIVVLYWFENVVIGVINVLKMLTATGKGEAKSILKDREDPGMPDYLRNPAVVTGPGSGLGARLSLTAFFIFHYGMFCFGHGVFVFVLLSGQVGGFIQGGPFALARRELPGVLDSGGIWFALAIVASHLFSFFYNYLGKGEYRRTSLATQMGAPYGRVIVLHVAILFGAILIEALGSPVLLLILLIIGKIYLDAKLHLRSRDKLETEDGRTEVVRP